MQQGKVLANSMSKTENREDWSADTRFKLFKDRLKHRDLLQEMLDDQLSKKSTEDWLDIFAGSVPASLINDIGEAMRNPFVKERNAIHEFPNPAKPNEFFKMVAHPIRSEGDAPLQNPAPRLGADTERLLDELGLEQISSRRASRSWDNLKYP